MNDIQKWENIEQLFDAMNNALDYCVLRNTEDINKEFSPAIHGDIDILVKNQKDAIRIMCAAKVHTESYRVCYKVLVADKETFFDIRYVGDGYYPKKWEDDILRSREKIKQDGIELYVMSSTQQYYTLLYHVYLQKQSVAMDYPQKLAEYASRVNLEYANDIKVVTAQLGAYMSQNQYKYEFPCDLAVGINWKNIRILCEHVGREFLFVRALYICMELTQRNRIKRRIRKLKGKIKKKLVRVEIEIDSGHGFLKDGEPYHITDINKFVMRSKILRIPTRDFITMQTYFSHRFRSWVMAVHVLYLEYLDGKNDVGLDFEKKLMVSIYGSADLLKQNEKINNLRQKRWDEVEPLDVDRDMRLIEGAMRLAIAYYDGADFINVRCSDYLLIWRYVYGRDFLLSLGFSGKELAVVEKKVTEILEDCRYLNTCIIWPPARNMYEELQKALTEYATDNITIHDYWDTMMSFEELKGFIEMAYKKDDALTWAIKMKSEFMHKASQVADDKYPMRFVRLRMQNPDYIVKPVSGQPYSQESLRCKETLRTIFKNKVEFYERDVVIHISDNYLQSQYLWLLSHIDRDLSKLFLKLDENEIVYTATNEKGYTFDHMNAQFAFGNKACIQISTKKTYLDVVQKTVLEFSNEHFIGQWIRVENFERGCNILLENECILRIRVEPYATND